MSHADLSKLSHGLKCSALVAILFPALLFAQTSFTHVHMRVSDTAEAAEWYQTLLGGERAPGGPGPSVRHANGFIGTMPNDGAAPTSAQSVIDHFGVTVADVAATIEKARSIGAVIDDGPRQGITANVIAFIVDPWGTRVELLEAPQYPGINHVHLFVDGSDDVRDWFLTVFGGELRQERCGDNFHCIRYDNIWVQISEADDDRAPSRGRSLDHMGFRITGALADFAAKIEASGYPPYLIRPNPPGSDLLFFEGPNGIHFEIVQRTQ